MIACFFRVLKKLIENLSCISFSKQFNLIFSGKFPCIKEKKIILVLSLGNYGVLKLCTSISQKLIWFFRNSKKQLLVLTMLNIFRVAIQKTVLSNQKLYGVILNCPESSIVFFLIKNKIIFFNLIKIKLFNKTNIKQQKL